MDNKVAVVTYSNNAKYTKGVELLQQSVYQYKKLGIDFYSFNEKGWKHNDKPQFPTHQENPYAFKGYAIKKIKEMGYTQIIWADAPIQFIKNPKTLLKHLDQKGYFFFDNIGFPLWQWISDKQLLEVTSEWNLSETIDRKYLRENNVQQIMGCFFGVNLESEFGAAIASNFIRYFQIPNFFKEAWTNERNQISKDSNVKGFRHDQSLLSLLIHIFKMDILKGQNTFFAYKEHYDLMPIADSVCVNSIGIE
jgi:hypothetical protein